VRTTAVPAGEDQKTYDLGKLNVATQGLPSAGMTCGELWVTYEVELRKPQISNNAVASAHYVMLVDAGTMNTSNPFGTNLTKYIDEIGITLSGKVLTIPAKSPGTYMLVVSHAGTALAETMNLNTIAYSNCTAITTSFQGYGGGLGCSGGEGTNTETNPTVFISIFSVPYSNSVSTVTLTYTNLTFNAGTGKGDTIVTRLSNSFV
jgi:hypothetical protein